MATGENRHVTHTEAAAVRGEADASRIQYVAVTSCNLDGLITRSRDHTAKWHQARLTAKPTHRDGTSVAVSAGTRSQYTPHDSGVSTSIERGSTRACQQKRAPTEKATAQVVLMRSSVRRQRRRKVRENSSVMRCGRRSATQQHHASRRGAKFSASRVRG